MNVQSVREIALALPGVTEAPHFDYGSFRVRGRIFVTVPPDGRHLHVFVDEQERLLALAMYPEAIEPLHWGKQVPGVRIDLARIEAAAVAHLVRAAWRNKAPRRLAAAAGMGGPAG
ncbi:MmcQ/YjbR family DNA-binding protein [Pseudoxanthomonas sp. J35]|uniref:MmcQ/YjbR family DNA-binding protein n=1 Tax=Pseudoxanthomonas sp. J35 TaxID=935852 RepID=UPI0004B3A98C|nr:MmcQ/YjbR family DNA-binding protein [Pseudoxanthomonas sp. J35]